MRNPKFFNAKFKSLFFYCKEMAEMCWGRSVNK